MEVWSGHIALDADGADKKLEDVRLYLSEGPPSPQINPGVTLHFLALVRPAAIPLYLVSGPHLEVYTANSSTEEWLSHNVLDSFSGDIDEGQSEAPWWTRRCGQSSVGVLLRVEGDMVASQNGRRVTELLVYAAIPGDVQSDEIGMLTPPRSSSPAADSDLPETGDSSQVKTARLYALPLSSDLYFHLNSAHGPRSPPADDLAEGFGRFIPDPTVHGNAEQSSQWKRQRLDSLFEDATQQRKRTKTRGGENVAKAMASLDRARKGNQANTTGTIKSVESGSNSPIWMAPSMPGHPRNLGITRTQSLGSLRELDQTRPSSRGSITALKRSSLHRVASVGAIKSSSPVPEAVNSIEQQNKNALARVVMAGMRMYGLQQKKKTHNPRAASEVPSSTPHDPLSATPTEGKDEYKLVYHQTYKTVSFALRRQISVTGISQDVMRDMVDQSLELFCVDPMQKVNISQDSFGTGTQVEQNVFDSPSDISGSQKSPACHITPRKNTSQVFTG